MAGDRVAVQQRRGAVSRDVIEERAVEPDVRVPELQRQRARRRIDAAHATALAVGDPEAEIVAFDHHGFADGERAARQLELDPPELARVAEVRPSTLVQVGNVGTPLGDYHRVLTGRRGQPLPNEPIPRRVLARLDRQRSMLQVELQRGIRPTGAEMIERFALPRVDLADVLAEFDGQPATHEPDERPAGADLGQLAVVANEHELPVGLLDMPEQFRELAGREHPGLIHDEHAAVGESTAAVEIVQQGGDARALDAGPLSQLVGRTPRHRDAQNRVARLLPRLASGAERERLARSCLSGHHREAVPAEAQGLDHAPLVRRQHRPCGYDSLDDGSVRHTRSGSTRSESSVDEVTLERQVLRRRIAEPIRARGKNPTVAPAKRLAGEPRFAIRDQRHGARREEFVAGAVEFVCVQLRAARKCFAQRLQHLAAGERGRLARESIRSGEIVHCRPPVPRLEHGSPPRSSDDEVQLPLSEAERLRPSAPLPRQRFRDNVRILRAARGECRRLGGPSPRRAPLRERRVDLGLPPAERARHGPRDTCDFRVPRRTIVHSTPTVRVSSLRSTTW